MTVEEYRNMVKGEGKDHLQGKLTVNPHEQRPFNYSRTQMTEIVNDLIDGYKLPSICLCDVETSYSRAKQDRNEIDEKYFGDYINRKIKYLIFDGQHRTEYLTKHIDGKFEPIMDKILNTKLKIDILLNFSYEELTRQFKLSNSGTRIKKADLLYSIINPFNQDFKSLVKMSGLTNYQKDKDFSKKERKAYGILLNSFKICAFIENTPFVNKKTEVGLLEDMVNQNFGLGSFTNFLESIRNFSSCLNSIDNPYLNMGYVQYNFIFAFHINILNDLGLNTTQVITFVNNLDNSDGTDLNTRTRDYHARYLEVQKQILNFVV